MEETNLYRARVQVVQAMEQGLPWHEAAKCAGLEISQSTAYRLRQRMRKAGEQALREGRHGHPIKLRGEARKFLEETCRQEPYTPSHEIQTQLVNPNIKRLMTDFGEKVRREKQAVIRKLLMKSAALHCPLALLSRFTKPGHEPSSNHMYT